MITFSADYDITNEILNILFVAVELLKEFQFNEGNYYLLFKRWFVGSLDPLHNSPLFNINVFPAASQANRLPLLLFTVFDALIMAQFSDSVLSYFDYDVDRIKLFFADNPEF